jgi:hypothetical protein
LVTFYELLSDSNKMNFNNVVFLNSCESSLGSYLPFENQARSLKTAFKIKSKSKAIISTIQSVDEDYSLEFSLLFLNKFIGQKIELRKAFYESQKEMFDKYKNNIYPWVGFTLTL